MRYQIMAEWLRRDFLFDEILALQCKWERGGWSTSQWLDHIYDERGVVKKERKYDAVVVL